MVIDEIHPAEPYGFFIETAVVTVVDDTGDPACNAAIPVSQEQFYLTMFKCGIFTGSKFPEFAFDHRGHPVGIIFIKGKREQDKLPEIFPRPNFF